MLPIQSTNININNVFSFMEKQHKSTIDQYDKCATYDSVLELITHRIYTNIITTTNKINVAYVTLTEFLIDRISHRFQRSIEQITDDITANIREMFA